MASNAAPPIDRSSIAGRSSAPRQGDVRSGRTGQPGGGPEADPRARQATLAAVPRHLRMPPQRPFSVSRERTPHPLPVNGLVLRTGGMLVAIVGLVVGIVSLINEPAGPTGADAPRAQPPPSEVTRAAAIDAGPARTSGEASREGRSASQEPRHAEAPAELPVIAIERLREQMPAVAPSGYAAQPLPPPIIRQPTSLAFAGPEVPIPAPRPGALAEREPPPRARSEPAAAGSEATPATDLHRSARRLLHRGQLDLGRKELALGAAQGDVRCALTLAKTYDPAVLKSWRIPGAKPDVAQARHWYERARQLGSGEAARRLPQLAKL